VNGGSDRISPAPDRQDDQKLHEKLLASLEKIAMEELKAKIQPGQRLLENSLHLKTVVQETRDPLEDQPADVLQLTMRVEFEGWYVEEADIQTVAQTALDANLPAHYQSVPGSLNYQFELNPLENKTGAEVVSIPGQLTAERKIKAAWSEADIIPAILGHSQVDAARVLQSRLELSAAPTIDLYPTWWHRLPFLPARITLVEP
jgi:hypothetical protein